MLFHHESGFLITLQVVMTMGVHVGQHKSSHFKLRFVISQGNNYQSWTNIESKAYLDIGVCFILTLKP